MNEVQQPKEQSPTDLPDELFSSRSHIFYALWLRGQGREEEAVAVFREADRRQNSTQGSAGAHYGVGVSRLRQGKPNEAVLEFEEAVRLSPDWAGAFDGLGRALDQAGRYDEAIAAFQEVLRLSPDYDAARLHMGNAYTHKRDLPAALQAYRASAQGYGDAHPDAHVCVADTLLALEERAEALAILLPLAEQYPNYAKIHLSAGLALATVGRIAEARQEWQRVLTIHDEFRAKGLGGEEQEALVARALQCLSDTRVKL